MIRHAKQEESEILTKLSFASKAYWNYPKEYFEIWNKELTISSDYILNNDVFVKEYPSTIPNRTTPYLVLRCKKNESDFFYKTSTAKL